MGSVEEWVAEVAPGVYGAALAAADDRSAAIDVTAHVLARSVASGRPDTAPEVVRERAMVLAARAAPCAELAPMRPEDREVVALARLGGRSVAQIAATLDLDERTVRVAMTRGLRDAANRRPVATVFQLA